MDKRQNTDSVMSIEQMFEDIPNNTFGNTNFDKLPSDVAAREKTEKHKAHGKDHHHVTAAHGHPHKTGRLKVIKSGSEFKPHNFTGIFKTLGATNVDDKSSHQQSKISTTSKDKAAGSGHLAKKSDLLGGSKSAEEARARRSKLSVASVQLDRMTPTTALAMFGSKLTQHEHSEIKEFNNIYFMGLAARKLGAGAVKMDPTIYDDGENFYNVVPRDHIAYRFEVVDKPNLGKGTFGQVVKAYDHKERRHVALKLVRNERIYLKQAREELRILQVLRKQDPHGFYNVVLIREFFMFRNHMVIVFELLGMNLYQVISKNGGRGLPIMKILPIARGILKCLELLFKNRLIHCDIKPENIMLRRNGDLGSIKVGDFGSSCYEQQQVFHYIQSRYYRAPEVILGMRYGPAIDMWSFGCVLAELSTGNPLFMGTSENDQLAAIEEVVGEIPSAMIEKSTKFKQGLHSHRSGRRGVPGTKSLANEIGGDENFKDLISKTLTLDPSLRPTPLELQDHNWLTRNRSTLTPNAAGQKSSKQGQRSS